METLKIPFKVKPGDNFQIKFVEKGKISPHMPITLSLRCDRMKSQRAL
jgi:hypothetical protein